MSTILRKCVKMYINITARVLVVTFTCFVMGCGGKPEGAQKRLEVHKVTGTVMYNGQPVEGAHVSFHPQESDKPGSFAKTNSSGVYTLRTYADGPAGAPEGEYQITIQKMLAAEPVEQKSGPEMFKEMERRAQSGEAPPSEAPTSLIPEKYARKQSSGLTATVKGGDTNTFDFDLKN